MRVEWPRVDRNPIALPRLGNLLDTLWGSLLDLAERLTDVPWTVVGGQMVLLHALEHDATPPRVSTDIDAVVDVRADQHAVRRLVDELQLLGFGEAVVSPEGYLHRFEKTTTAGTTRVDIAVDVLVPEGLGPRTDTTTIKPGRAFPAPGTTQALERTEYLPVSHGQRTAWLPRPSLLGAVVGKAVAATVDNRDVDRHLLDLAFLCSLIEEPLVLREALSSKDRSRLAKAARVLPAEHSVWAAIDDPDQARAAWHLLQGAAR